MLDAPYDTLELALAEASDWCTGQGSRCPMGQQGIAVEVRTDSGSWRTIDYRELFASIQRDGGLMWVSVDLCVVPIGVGVSLSRYIAACERVIAATGLMHQLGPNGTAIEGLGTRSWTVCVLVGRVAGMGAPRLYTTLKLNTRTDRQQSLSEKVASVEQQLAGPLPKG